MRARTLVVAMTIAAVLGAMAQTSVAGTAAEFPTLARSPYPMQHVNPRAADYIDRTGPIRVRPAWSALTDLTIPQPCSSGPEGHLYCMRAWDHPGTDRCNLQALDGRTGALLWEDRVNGHCLLDQYAWVTNPTIDGTGNLYVADSRLVASFSARGRLRWIDRFPGRLVSPRGLPNNPFGLNFLPSGDLVTATMGDGYVLVLDRHTGRLRTAPFLLPSDKRRVAGAPSAPPGFLADLASPDVGPVLWDVGLGISNDQVDNNVAVDPHTGLIFITGGAPAPNPSNDGALWAVRYDARTHRLGVQWVVRFPGPGGIATTPTVTMDGNYVLIGDNQANFVAVDITACAIVPQGNECHAYASSPAGAKLGASVTVTPDDRVYVALSTAGLAAYRITRANGAVTLQHLFTRAYPGQILTTVLTGFRNVIWLGLSTPGHPPTHVLAAVRPDDGTVISTVPAGDLANVTMDDHPSRLVTNDINFFDETQGAHGPAGVHAWSPDRASSRARPILLRRFSS